jgi:hypothetical protein
MSGLSVGLLSMASDNRLALFIEGDETHGFGVCCVEWSRH